MRNRSHREKFDIACMLIVRMSAVLEPTSSCCLASFIAAATSNPAAIFDIMKLIGVMSRKSVLGLSAFNQSTLTFAITSVSLSFSFRCASNCLSKYAGAAFGPGTLCVRSASSFPARTAAKPEGRSQNGCPASRPCPPKIHQTMFDSSKSTASARSRTWAAFSAVTATLLIASVNPFSTASNVPATERQNCSQQRS